jgi:predicted O-methyltransferase YrrM
VPRRVRQVIERLVSEGGATANLDGTVHSLFPVAVDAGEGTALRDWVIREKAERTIEVGLGYGVSALFICEGLLTGGVKTPQHSAIDPNQATWYSNVGLQVLAEAGVKDLVEHHAEESQIVLPRLLNEGRSFDLAFVDGNHRFDGVFLDLVYLGRLVRPGRCVFVDDYQLPSVRRGVSFCLTNLGWAVESISPVDDFHQWAVLRTSDKPDTRAFDFFVDF